MSDGSAINWTNATWNPLLGCARVSPGCDSCYAISQARIRAGNPNPKVARAFGGLTEHIDGRLDWTGRVNLLPERLDQPLHWRKPRKVFVNSLADLFHEDVPDEFIACVFTVMARTPQHTYQLLTKRHGRMRSLLSSPDFQVLCSAAAATRGWDMEGTPWPLPNVHLGVSIEDQKWADIRIPALLKTPAAVRWVSAEPLLGPVDLRDWRLDWIVAGGESGAKARPMHPAWVRRLRDQCDAADVPFWFKQWGEWGPKNAGAWPLGDVWRNPGRHCWVSPDGGRTKPFGEFTGTDDMDWALMRRVGTKVAGRELDGQVCDEFPRTAEQVPS